MATLETAHFCLPTVRAEAVAVLAEAQKLFPFFLPDILLGLWPARTHKTGGGMPPPLIHVMNIINFSGIFKTPLLKLVDRKTQMEA